jgi:two-component system, OmpR family, sensor kinase
MSSSRPDRAPVLGRVRARFDGWTLRKRLLAGILVLFTIAFLTIGVASVLTLRTVLFRQVDSQLSQVDTRAGGGGGSGIPPRNPNNGGGFPVGGGGIIFTPGQASGTIRARVVDGQLTAYVLDPDAPGRQRMLSTTQSAPLLGVVADNRPYTVDLGDLGDYRVVATATSDGDVLTGLPLTSVQDAVWLLVLAEIAVGVVGLLLVGFGGAAIVRLSLRPLQRVATTAVRVTELPLAKGEVDLSVRVPERDTDPRTEVGQVGAALNRLLGHVGDALAARQASEMRVRQFVADASHELRTPLAAIRGYAELTRRGRDEVPPDVAHALGRVESESARMTTLVDDLLLLARLDSGRPLERDPVELSGLVVDAVNDAHAAGRDHRWLLDLPGQPVTVPGDAARLHQVLANLLANARTHTPAGTTVTTSLTTVDGRAVLTVSDDGPGIPDQLQPDVFVRFARGDSSRSRAAGSTGLGLAIVAAVVEAHGGRVEVASRPSRTTFTVHLQGAESGEPDTGEDELTDLDFFDIEPSRTAGPQPGHGIG